MKGLFEDSPPLSLSHSLAAHHRQQRLTKPSGALGRLETLSIYLASALASECPQPTGKLLIFAADHGCAVDTAAYPQTVTAQMIANIADGGAACSVLSRAFEIPLEVINLGTVSPVSSQLFGVHNDIVSKQTNHFAYAPAMTSSQRESCFQAGISAVNRAISEGVNVLLLGELGIGNTASAAALASALLQRPAHELVGPGSSLDTAGIKRKIFIVQQALNLHCPQNPLDALTMLGGFEIAALTAAYLQAAQKSVPCLVDGFIALTAALCAVKLQPKVADWLIYAHQSAEPGAKLVEQALGAKPLLNLEMRLGEGTGALMAWPLICAACALLNEMATFAEASVDEHL